MEITKETIVDRIEVLENGIVQVRFATNILENGTVISKTFMRDSISPGRDYSNQPDNVKAICQVVHTPQVIADYKALLEANTPKLG